MSKLKFYLLLTTIYIIIAIIFTYPMPLHPNTMIYGYPGDSFGTLWRMRWYKDARQVATSDFSYNPNLAAPFGTYFPKEATPVLYFEPLKLMTFLTNEVFAYNFILFLSFVLTPLFTFFLFDYLTKSKMAAFIGSLIFNLAPYHFWHAFNHLDLAQIQWLPLYVLALLNLERQKNIKAAFLAAGVYLLVIYTSFYYGYFMLLFTPIFLVLKIVFEFNFRALSRRFLSVLIFILLILLGAFPLIKFNFSQDSLTELFSEKAAGRTIESLFGVTARPWDYIVPSINHPLFGKYAGQFYNWLEANLGKVKSSSTFVQERTVYLGVINLILMMVGIVVYLKRRFHRQNSLILVFFLTAVILAIISGPPFVRIFGYTFYLPPYYLFNVTDFLKGFRVYARLGVVVLLCVSAISAYGVRYIIEALDRKLKAFPNKSVTISAFCLLLSVLVIFDFLNFSPFNVTDVSRIPGCYQWLETQPGDFIFLEYPDLYAYTDALLFQRVHQKKLFNMMGGSFHDTIWPLVKEIDKNEAIDHLQSFGVKYIFVHTKNIFPLDELDRIRYLRVATALDEDAMPDNLEIAKQCPEGTIYKIKDFQSKDKIYILHKKFKNWFPSGDWELQKGINHLLVANTTTEAQTMQLLFDTDILKNNLEIKIQEDDKMREIDNQPVMFPLGLTRMIIWNKENRNVILKNLEFKEIRGH